MIHVVNGIRMVSAMGPKGQVLAKTGPVKTQKVNSRCKSTFIKVDNARQYCSSYQSRKLRYMYGNSKPATPKDTVEYSVGIDPNMEVGNRDIDS